MCILAISLAYQGNIFLISLCSSVGARFGVLVGSKEGTIRYDDDMDLLLLQDGIAGVTSVVHSESD